MRREKNALIGEVEEGRAVEEEGALLGKEQREPRQVDQALVDLGFGEVGVDGGHAAQARRDVVGHVDADVGRAVGATAGMRPGRVGRVPAT